jgi:phage terminase large subunit-like protein
MSALAMLFENELGGFDCKCKFWAPRDGRWKDEQRNRENYPRWEREGWLTFTAGEATDFDQVERDILELNDAHPFRILNADRAYATHLLSRLFNNHELPVKGIPQGPITLNEPMVRLESMILDQKFRHDDNPILNWNVANATVERTSTGLMHLDKSGQTKRIDGLAAVVNALAGSAIPDDSASVYNSEELLIL